MPIKQERLIVLLEILDQKYERETQLANQTHVLRREILTAAQSNDFSSVELLMGHLEEQINIVTRPRPAEFYAFLEEKKHFEINASHNEKSREIAARGRERAKRIISGAILHDQLTDTEKEMQDRAQSSSAQTNKTKHKQNDEELSDEEQANKLYSQLNDEWDKHTSKPVLPHDMARVLRVSEGRVNKIIIPYLLDKGLLIQPDAAIHAYIPKQQSNQTEGN
jgi:hypothetical protein